MDQYCGLCAHLDINGACQYSNEYYCTKIGKYRSTNKEACEYFIERPKGGYQRAGFSFWYVVSQICKMLDISLESDFFKTLYSLKTYLAQTEDGQEFLKQYNTVGPILAAKLAEEGKLFAMTIFCKFLKPCADEIYVQKYDNAFAIYKNMLEELMFCYNISRSEEIKLARISQQFEECK